MIGQGSLAIPPVFLLSIVSSAVIRQGQVHGAGTRREAWSLIGGSLFAGVTPLIVGWLLFHFVG